MKRYFIILFILLILAIPFLDTCEYFQDTYAHRESDLLVSSYANHDAANYIKKVTFESTFPKMNVPTPVIEHFDDVVIYSNATNDKNTMKKNAKFSIQIPVESFYAPTIKSNIYQIKDDTTNQLTSTYKIPIS